VRKPARLGIPALGAVDDALAHGRLVANGGLDPLPRRVFCVCIKGMKDCSRGMRRAPQHHFTSLPSDARETVLETICFI
jgi:hypothetical protein